MYLRKAAIFFGNTPLARDHVKYGDQDMLERLVQNERKNANIWLVEKNDVAVFF